MSEYCKRQWLNPEDRSSSGSVVAYHGQSPWKGSQDEKNEKVTFLEVADCHGKIRLHKTDVDTRQDFINKMRLIATIANDFADFLEGEK